MVRAYVPVLAVLGADPPQPLGQREERMALRQYANPFVVASRLVNRYQN